MAKTRPFDRLRDLRLDVPTGNTYSSPGRVRWPGRRAGKRQQGMAKRLTFTEGRLRLPLGTTRPESQAFRCPRGGPIEAALNFSLHFLSREKEGIIKTAPQSQDSTGFLPIDPMLTRMPAQG